MTNTEINKFLYEAIGSGCWHEVVQHPVKGEIWTLAICDRDGCDEHDVSVPDIDYCSSLDAVSVVEQFIIARSGRLALHYQLMKAMEPVDSASQLATASVFASALQRSRACVAFFKESSK